MTLNILNGDALAERCAAAGLGGEPLVFREALVLGPCPVGDADFIGGAAPRGEPFLGSSQRSGEPFLGSSQRSGEPFIDLRARHLGETYGQNPLLIRRDLGRFEARLAVLGSDDDVRLWFEDDLFCQVHLWYLLGRLGDRCRVRVVACDELAGAAPADLPRLAAEAAPVTAAQVAWARAAFRAYGGADPGALLGLPADDAPAAFAPLAARLHVERFPWTSDGLGRPERAIVQAIAAGVDRFGDLFRRFMTEQAGYGFGDAQVFVVAAALAVGPTPLLRVHGVGDPAQAIAGGALRSASFSVTDAGRQVLAEQRDAVADVQVERWLGGVRLPPGATPWRFDCAQRGRLVTTGR